MATYHVGAGAISGEIYAGTLSKDGSRWQNRTIVTDEAVAAVRDHFLSEAMSAGQDFFGYEWTRKDGKKISLRLIIRDAEPGREQENNGGVLQ